MMALACCASSCCMFVTCWSGLSLSSTVITRHPRAFPWATTPFCHAPSVSLAAIGFWKPMVHFVPFFFTGFAYAVGNFASGPLYPFGTGTPTDAANEAATDTASTTAPAASPRTTPLRLLFTSLPLLVAGRVSPGRREPQRTDAPHEERF